MGVAAVLCLTILLDWTLDVFGGKYLHCPCDAATFHRNLVVKMLKKRRASLHKMSVCVFALCMRELALWWQHPALSKRAASASSVSTSCFRLPQTRCTALLKNKKIYILFLIFVSGENSCGQQQMTVKIKRELSADSLVAPHFSQQNIADEWWSSVEMPQMFQLSHK